MNTTQAVTDKLAIGLSLGCAIHCLSLPIILAMHAQHGGIAIG